jgi:hypothetical protein
MEHEAVHHTKHQNTSILYYLSLVFILISLVLLILSYYQMQPLIWTPKIQFPNLIVQPSPTPIVSTIRDVVTPQPLKTQTDLKPLSQSVSQINPQQLLQHMSVIQKEAASFTH